MKVISSISNSVKFYIASQDFMHLRAKFFVMEPCNYKELLGLCYAILHQVSEIHVIDTDHYDMADKHEEGKR